MARRHPTPAIRTMPIPRFLLALVAAASLSACAADGATAPAAAPALRLAQEDEDGPERYHDRYSIPMDVTFWVPCANGGEGEFVHATGVIAEQAKQQEDGSGTLHYRSQARLQGFMGTGEATGAMYVASGGFSLAERIIPGEGPQYTALRRERDRIQVVGGGVVFVMDLLTRETYGAGTVPTHEVVVERVSCR